MGQLDTECPQHGAEKRVEPAVNRYGSIETVDCERGNKSMTGEEIFCIIGVLLVGCFVVLDAWHRTH